MFSAMQNDLVGDVGLTADAGASIAVYAQAMRVRSLWISTVCVLSGGAMAIWHGRFDAAGLFLAWLGAVAVQAGTNLTNVFHNYKASATRPSGALFDPQGSSAPVRLGLLSPVAVRRAALACFAIGLLAGVALTAQFGWRILAMGVPGLLAGYFYAAPPVRLAYLGLGVFTVFLFMGPVMVAGTYWVETGTITTGTLVASVSIGLLAAGIMHVNDVRDFASDVAHGKRTLSIAVGRHGASWLLVAMNITAFLLIVIAVSAHWLPWTVLLVLVTVPGAVRQSQLVIRQRDPVVLNGAWFMSVKLLTQFGALFIAALLIARALAI
jgi:1,4-dihydroxy-2-naphthoate octaprenyltransferase